MLKVISYLSTLLAIFFVLFFSYLPSFAQNYADKKYYLLDSFNLELIGDYDKEIVETNLKAYHAEKHDSLKLPFIQNIIEGSWDLNIWPRYNEWIYNYTTEKLSIKNLSVQEKKFYQKQQAKAINNKGYLAHETGDYPTAIYYYNESLMMQIALKDSFEVALLLNNLAGVYELIGNSQKTLDLNFKALALREALHDEIGIAQTCNNIGSIYDNLKKDSLALNYYHRSFNLRSKNNDIYGLTSSAHNISSIYIDMKMPDSASYYSNLSIHYCKQINHQMGLAYAYNNLGIVYANKGMNDSALYYYQLSNEAHTKINNKRGLSLSLTNIASMKYRKWLENGNKPSSLIIDAIAVGEQGHQMALELNSPSAISTSAFTMAKIYVAKNDAAKTFEMLELYYRMRDSVNNVSIKEAAFEKQTQYEYEKQKTINDLEHEKQLAVEQANQERQTIIIYFVLGGVIVLIIFIYIIFQRLKITRLQNIEIEKQRVEITLQHEQLEESHKEIKDSITYAKRIQNAILPKQEIIQKYLPHSFVLYEPKDIVAGDFYWFQQHENKIYIAAADCTGHGVPGAMVSVVCNNALNKSLKIFHLTEVNEILNKTRELIIEELDTESDGTIKDGMDIALCCIEKNGITFSGANNPLWIVRNGDIIEYKSDKQPVGNFEKASPFTKHNIQTQSNDIYYIFTDGYVDQFGGEKGKKLKSKGFKELLLAASKLPLQEQAKFLRLNLNQWRDSLEQNDDICVIGFKI